MSLIETKAKLQGGTATIGIVGMGYVGVPLALLYSKRNQNSRFRCKSERVASLQDGKSPLKHIPVQAIQEAREKSLLEVTDDFSQVASAMP